MLSPQNHGKGRRARRWRGLLARLQNHFTVDGFIQTGRGPLKCVLCLLSSGASRELEEKIRPSALTTEVTPCKPVLLTHAILLQAGKDH